MGQKDEKYIGRLLAALQNQIEGGETAPDLFETDWLKSFIDQIPGGFFVYEARDEKILFANKALYDIFGCETYKQFEKLTGGTFRGMVYPEDLKGVEDSINEQIANNDNHLDYVEYRIVRRDGSVRWIEDYGHYVKDDLLGGLYYVFINDATDKITHRIELLNAKQEKEQIQGLIQEYDQERKLIRQEELQRLEVIEGLSVNYDSILYVDLDADIVLPYRLSMRLTRQFENKLQPKPFKWFLRDYVSVWVHPEDKKTVAKRISVKYIRDKLVESPTYYLNYRCIYKGETQYIQLRMVNVGDPQRVNKVVMGFRNVDVEILQEMEQKRLYEEALKSARLANETKTTFLSNISHDLRTPLNAIFGYLTLARKNINNATTVGGYLDKIETSSKRMFELVEKVLMMTYTESQKLPVVENECNISSIMRGVQAAVEDRATRKNIALTVNQSVKHDAVITDEDKLEQVLVHLADNAVKFTPTGGKVTVSVEEHEKSAELSTYKFTVEDNGVGISPEALQRIFDPFERETSSTISGEYGMGLGLTIAKHIAEMLGGQIDVKSKVKAGSTFTVTVGLRLPKENNAAAYPTSIRHGAKILLVEDNEFNREVETEILEDLGFVIECAENGRIAVDKLKAAKRGEYAIVLMDIQMPVLDGRDATREIRSLNNSAVANIPIVALSANAFESDKIASIECGMDDHLAKPIDVDLLLSTINRVLAEKSAQLALSGGNENK